jgi:hypothetical protein
MASMLGNLPSFTRCGTRSKAHWATLEFQVKSQKLFQADGMVVLTQSDMKN